MIIDAFKKLFKFSNEFPQEFFGMITSKVANVDLRIIKEESSKALLASLSQILSAPKAFPSELMRFFEQT